MVHQPPAPTALPPHRVPRSWRCERLSSRWIGGGQVALSSLPGHSAAAWVPPRPGRSARLCPPAAEVPPRPGPSGLLSVPRRQRSRLGLVRPASCLSPGGRGPASAWSVRPPVCPPAAEVPPRPGPSGLLSVPRRQRSRLGLVRPASCLSPGSRGPASARPGRSGHPCLPRFRVQTEPRLD